MSTRSLGLLTSMRLRAAFLGLTILSTALGCSAEGGSDEGPFVSPVLDPASVQSAVVGPEGGSVRATSADGTVYTLTIPSDALAEETEISLTPIRAIDDLPMSGGLIDAVHFEPSGLVLLRAAMLTVERASPPAIGEGEVFVGFTYDGDGENLALAVPEVDGNTFNLPIHHFSGGGAGAATPADLEAAYSPGTTDAFIAELSAAVPTGDPDTFESIMRRWYQAVVKPRLQAAVANDGALERALDDHERWLDAWLMLGVFLDDLANEGYSLAALALSDAVARANDLCARQRSFAHAEKAMVWHRRAAGMLPTEPLFEHGLDHESVLVDLCVQVAYESTSYPADPIVGEPEPLRVVVGYTFGDGPIELDAGMVVNILGIEARPFGTAATTDESGVIALAMTPEGGDLRIEVHACIGNVPGAGPLVGEFVCQEAFILRGLIVTPARTTLAPGARQQFTAQRVGIDAPVTWAAEGGTIDAAGLFTAGGTAGTFTVTATSIDDPSRTASAEVTIEVQESDFPASALWEGVTVGVTEFQTFVEEAQLQTTFDPSTGTLSARSCEGTDCLGNPVGCDALWEGTASGNQFSLTMFNHTNACGIGRPGQNRLYGCTLTGSMSQDPDGTIRLVGSGDGSFFSCLSDDDPVSFSFEVCIGGCPG